MHERAIRKHAQNLERTVRQRTAELAESERRYKTLVDEINDGYFMIQDERIAYANRAFCRMHHAKLGEVLGRPYLDFVTEDCRSRVSEAYGKALKGRSAVKQLEFTRTGPPIERAATEIKSKVVDLGQGPVTIGICRDISQRVAMEAKIREHERLAYVGHIAASLSHEIRNPLSTCTLNMQILEEKLALDGFDRRRLVITVRELTRLENILRQLLDIARPVSLLPAPLDLKELAQDCLVLLEGKVAEKGIEIRQRHALDLPLIEADGAKLEQALLNLMLNAIEAVGQGGRITLWTRSRTHKTGSSVDLGVHDNGPGIDSQQMDQLFTPFATSKSQGTGLGLANVKRIAEAHHGKVIVKSRRGRGATFILRLPCAP
jgi:PAS domain S-box-containing protein